MLRFLVPPSVGVARAQARGELLERSLSSDLGDRVQVEVAPDYATFERVAREAGAELLWAPAAICAHVADDARAVFKVVRAGRSTYRSALIARADAHVGIAQLAGKRAAWVDRRSIGGYLLVAQHLRERGIDPDRTFASQDFVGTHPAALAAVIEDRADVAAVSVASGESEHVEQALSLHGGRAGATRLAPILITDTAPTDALVITPALDVIRAEALIERIFPPAGGRERTTALKLAMEADGFERAADGEYARLKKLG
ncbi:phosphate/phosphite/phosphonate ABC transporter substrate-binding protein [Sandaracinus amylolyticus]|uniref:Phosphonate ABC transporter phosphate-binding periplasmic component n=1 Tax=Sandaracinus amylolyticus TaxID=927083 RepID=A0A0F6W4K3_9BACT|nr:PhnD/SsuA/transferrin family substrate-binding protein [Sandaracinus amylolyticus]AKF07152.1 Phosphonate ABC transporter phosphate-binding periplasmic component [Sandaracinus amylolyticus]